MRAVTDDHLRRAILSFRKIIKSRHHNDALINKLVRKYDYLLKRVILRYLPPGEDAEDIAQEVYLRIARKSDPTPIDNEKAFLVRTAKNLIIDLIRYRKARDQDRHSPLMEDHVMDDSPGPEQIVAGRQSLERFQQIVCELPEKCRHVYILQRVKGMTYNQIAAHMGLSVSSVEKHMMTAIDHTVERMGEKE